MFDAGIPARLEKIGGNLSLWLENLESGETLKMNPDGDHIAASVIKLGVLLAAFKAFDEGRMNPDALVEVKAQYKVPSCGALTYMHDRIKVTNLDLATLMIILSDNTATNMLIDALGIDYINEVLREYGLSGICLRRKLFDSEASANGLENTVTARDVAAFYRLLYLKQLVSPAASDKMLSILLDQRLNGKIPFYLHERGIKVAHKTGEDDGVTHDTGIIFAYAPIIAVFLGNDTSVPGFERTMQDIAKEIAL